MSELILAVLATAMICGLAIAIWKFAKVAADIEERDFSDPTDFETLPEPADDDEDYGDVSDAG